MTLPTLRKRLDRIEGARSPGYPAGVARIITESDEDAAAQIAALATSGLHTPGQIVIDRRIVDPRPRMLDA